MDLLNKHEKEYLMQQDVLDAIDSLDFDYVFHKITNAFGIRKIFQFLNDSEYCGFEKILGKSILNWMSFIPNCCFYERDITDITIPNSITEIGMSAFEHCSLLKHVELPDSLLYIQSGAFSICHSLNEIKLPDKLSVISDNAFRGCRKLKEVTLNDMLTTIKNRAFSDCSSLNEIVIPDSVTDIHDSAFLNCGDNFTIYCHSGSYAEEYAKENNINCKII